jgi:hypothetical protein
MGDTEDERLDVLLRRRRRTERPGADLVLRIARMASALPQMKSASSVRQQSRLGQRSGTNPPHKGHV